MNVKSTSSIRDHFRTIEGTTMAEYPAEVTEARRYMAMGLTEALKGEDRWPDWISEVAFASDFVLINTEWCNPRNNSRGYHFVVVPSEVHHKHWNHGDNPYYMRDSAEDMLRFINSR